MTNKSKILIVDDEIRMLDSLKKLLSGQDCEIHTSNSGAEAIDCLTRGSFDLVLLDLVMPGIDGFTVMDHIKSQNSNTSVIFMTGHSTVDSAITALRKGAYDYIKKPFEYEELLNTIENALHHITLKKDKIQLETQLNHAQRMESLGTLAGGIAHDFNNLLMGIQGRTSLMLLDTDFHHPHFEHLKGLEEYIKSASDLTKQLLAFARGGKYEVIPTDLNEIIRKGSEMFGRTKKEITIIRKNHENIWTVEVDRSQIEQIMLNLYVNAWQSMPGGGELYIETENVVLNDDFVRPYEVDSGKYVKVSVTDTGVGMDKATQERIFDPFFTTKEMGRGTGLGLASAYGIVKNHGGIFKVFSEKGEGAVFSIFLPASEKEVIKDKELSSEIMKGDETILLVDDEDIIIDVGTELLKQMGYKVLAAKSGKASIKLYEANRDKIDMVILDMIMPDMDGGETYDKMRKINPDIKVLLSSGYSIDGQATEILERGCSGFIQKPYNLRKVAQKIREILNND